MANDFDPYYQWLGIPKHEQPPNHYRLLGIQLFESQPAVIQNAGDQRMAHLKTLSTGPRAVLSQQVLNELSAALACLLTPAKKKVYDAQLQTDLAATPPSDCRSARPLVPGASTGIRVRRVRKRRKKRAPAGTLIALVSVVGMAVVAYLFWPKDGTTPASTTIANAVTPSDQSSKSVGNGGSSHTSPNKQVDRPDKSQSAGKQARQAKKQPTSTPPDMSAQDTTHDNSTSPNTNATNPPDSQGPPIAKLPDQPKPSENEDNPFVPQRNPSSAPATSGTSDPTMPATSTVPPSSVPPDSGDPTEPNAPNSDPPVTSNKPKTAVLDLSDKDSCVELLGVTNIEKIQVAIVGVKNLPTSYHLNPDDGIVRAGEPVCIELDQPRGIRIRLSLDMKKTIAQLHVAPEMNGPKNEPVDFSQTRTKRAYRAAKKKTSTIAKQLAATQTAFARVNAWLNSRGVKDRAARDNAVKQRQLLQGQILATEQQLLFAQNLTTSLQQLAQLADRIHNTTTIEFFVQTKTDASMPDETSMPVPGAPAP